MAKSKTEAWEVHLRIPPGMKPVIETAAVANLRSINAEIVYRLGTYGKKEAAK